MYLSAYHFDGDPTALLPAYDRMREGFPPEALLWHLCVVTERGITVLDACPSRAEFERFSASPEFRGAVASAGLPAARIEPVGAVHATAGAVPR
jgi:hypothetical protein